MTIRPGEDWGEVIDAPLDGVPTCTSDAAVGDWLAARQVPTTDVVRITGGDLLATVGGASSPGGQRRYPIDVVRVELDRHSAIAVAHVICRRRGPIGWWRGRLLAVLNVGSVGDWDVAPRAHPNDGRFDVVDVAATMSVQARWHARRRLPTGTHVPHPDITVTRPREGHATWNFGDTLTVWVDGRRVGRSRSLTVRIEPDACSVLA